MADKITLKTLKEWAKACKVKGYTKFKMEDFEKLKSNPLMDAITKLAKDEKWRNAKKNQPMINWYNEKVDELAKADKKKDVDDAGEADKKKDKGKGKKKDKKKDKKKPSKEPTTPETPDIAGMDQEALINLAIENIDKIGVKKKKIKKMKEKKLRSLLTEKLGSTDDDAGKKKDSGKKKTDLEDAKKKAGKAKDNAAKKKDKKKKDKKKKGGGRKSDPELEKIKLEVYKLWKKDPKKWTVGKLDKKFPGDPPRKSQINNWVYRWKKGENIPK